MKNCYKRYITIGCFVILLILLIVNAAITRRRLAVQTAMAGQVRHTYQVLSEIGQIESLLQAAETGERGYLYTGDPQYLTPYMQSISLVDPRVNQLERLTQDNAFQRALIPALRGLAHDKLNEMAQTLRLYRSNKPAEARALVTSDVGLRAMRQLRDVLGRMTQEEDSLMVRRNEAYIDCVHRTVISIYLATLMACFGVIAIAVFILRLTQIQEKHTSEMRLREEWYRVTLTSIGDAVIATDPKGMVTFLNPIGEKLIGISQAQATGRDIHDVFPIFNEVTHLPTENPVAKVMELGYAVELSNHTVLQHADGRLIPIEDSAAPIRDDRHRLIGCVLVFRDVTREHQTQTVLRRTEKLAAAARLSATVAHEINNPLEAIGNLIYIAKTTSGVSPEIVERLEQAEQELARIAHITRQALGFYRETSLPEWVEMSELVESVLNLYSNKLAAKAVEVVRNFGENLSIFAVKGELKQVVSNLILNALDALENNGTITINLRCNGEDGHKLLRMVVKDDGTGIAPGIIERIFEPFFTTKQDVGTGLGLWITKQIIERHGGTIQAQCGSDAKSGGGAVFTVLIPVGACKEEPVAHAV